ncbi:hypothetical protein ACVBEQ_27595 [Nakamurella sp. GG22]
MSRRLAEIGLPGQQLPVLDGGDVDAATGRLLTVAELQAALLAAQVMAAKRAAALVGPGTPQAEATRRAETEAAAVASAVDAPPHGASSQPGARRWSPRWSSKLPVHRSSVLPEKAVSAPGALAPAGFTGPAAVRAWSWLTGAPDPSVLVCAAGGGVGATTVVAVLAGLIAAARPDRVLAVEVARRDFSPLTRQVCGPVDAVSVGTWLEPGDAPVRDLSGLPAGPSGARVVQAGAQWWPQLTARLPADTAVVADLGSLEHRDTHEVLLGHCGPTVMVARADSAGVTAALAAITELDAAGLARRPVLVLCDAAGSRPGVLRTAKRLAATAADVLVLPKAPALRRGPVPICGWDRALSDALAELVCALARSEAAPPADHRPLPLADTDTGSDTAADDPEALTERELS